MPQITFLEANGTRHDVEIEEQMNLMEGATLALIPGIDGFCGGVASCATCHCQIEGDWSLPTPSTKELAMLDTAKGRIPSSRLGCQIVVDASMEGMQVQLPAEQGSIPEDEE